MALSGSYGATGLSGTDRVLVWALGLLRGGAVIVGGGYALLLTHCVSNILVQNRLNIEPLSVRSRDGPAVLQEVNELRNSLLPQRKSRHSC